jgi:pyruvate/2-oxoglutarate dehydrogenase complex dihydrolipoamide acyltransferase (E2) component
MIYRLSVPMTLEDNEEVRVLEWHVEPDARFAEGTLLVELETHKALIEVRAEQSGVLRERHVEEGVWCPLGGLLALISDTPDEPLTDGGHNLAAEFLIG